MIRMSYLDLMNPEFRRVADVLWNCPQLDGHTSYRAHRIKKGMDKVLKEAGSLQMEMAKKYARKSKLGPDENSPEILLRDDQGRLMFENEEKAKEFENEFATVFSEKYLELKVNKIDFRAIAAVKGLTPNHWPYLEFIVENLPDEMPEEAAP